MKHERTSVEIVHDGNTVLNVDPRQVETGRPRMIDAGMKSRLSFKVDVLVGRNPPEQS